jgi:hypothetical protein
LPSVRPTWLIAIFLASFGAGLAALWVIVPFILLNYVFKNCILKFTPQDEFAVGYVEMSLTAISAIINPALFAVDFAIEAIQFFLTVKSLSGPPKDQSFPNCLNPFG